MKFASVMFCCVILTAGVGVGRSQTTLAKTESSKYILGSKVVIIPAPDGFIDVVPRFDQVTTRFLVTESPSNDLLAVHVPRSIVPALEKGDNPSLDFYTKVSVLRTAKALGATPAIFKAAVDEYEKLSPTMFDANSEFLKSATTHINKGLTDLNGSDTKMDFGQPKSLGYFEKQSNIYSAMMIADINESGTNLGSLLMGLSFVRVNSRIIFVYTYRKLRTASDAATLRDFTKKWTAAIVAANK